VVARRVQNDGAQYYGPFYPATAMRESLRLVRQLFPLRTCTIKIDGRLERPGPEQLRGEVFAGAVLGEGAPDLFEAQLSQWRACGQSPGGRGPLPPAGR